MKKNNLFEIASFTPELLDSPSAWIGHLPFAAWVIKDMNPSIFVELGTHFGHSYFSFCQSVLEEGLITNCYAVDTWQGDEHAGIYDGSIFDGVNAHNIKNFASFSRLLRMPFDQAVSLFEDNSIDLLHIDGMHSYEAVKHDFETWLPKLAPGAVVIFHDTQVKDRGFGVHKLWEELQNTYTSNIEFTHSHGLGVLQLNNVSLNMRMPWLNTSSDEKQSFIRYFSALGSHQSGRYELHKLQQQVAQLNQSIVQREEHIAQLNQSIVQREEHIAQLNQSIVQREEHIAQLNEMIVNKDVHIRNLCATILNYEEVNSSISWFITMPLRLIESNLNRFMKRTRFFYSLVSSYIDSCGGFWPAFLKVTKVLRRYGLIELIKKIYIFKLQRFGSNVNAQHTKSYENYISIMEPKAKDYEAMVNVANKFAYQPKFSIAVPVYNVDVKWLSAAIESVLAQVYENWELCIADDCSTATQVKHMLEMYASKDERIKVVFRETNGHISAATNSALELATGDFLCLMDNDDEIAPSALFEFASLLNHDRSLDMIYSDEDKLDMAGNRYEPFFKPDWSPETLEGCMFTAHFACYRIDLVRELGGFRSDFNGAQDYDFVLRFTERTSRIKHVPKVLYHWRAIPGSTAATMDAKNYVLDAALRALRERAERLSGGGDVRLGPFPGCFDLRYKIIDSPLVSIVIPSAGRLANIRGKDVDLLSQVIISIYEKTTYRNFEVIVVDNNDLRDETIEALKPYECKFVHFEGKFNIANKMNMGAKAARGEYLLFMNDDIEVITPDWMECMLQLCQRNRVGIVGAKLHYEDESLQHVGVAFWNGLPDHIHRAYPRDYPGHFFSASANRNCLAVTGAVLMTKREIFQSVGGFDERFAINYNDIDYCLKVFNEGFRIVLAAGAQLYHYESQSREAVVAEEEINLFQQKWSGVTSYDPYYSIYFENHPPAFILRDDWAGIASIDPL